MSGVERISPQFNGTGNGAKSKVKKRRRPSPLSIRISDDERAALKRAANGQSLNSFARERLLATRVSKRSAVADYEALAQVLGMLGRSDIHTKLSALLLAIEANTLNDTATLTEDIKLARSDISDMRAMLVTALGLRG